MAGLLFVSFAVYVNSLENGFHFDDHVIISGNPLVSDLNHLPTIFVSNYWANTPYEGGVLLYRPLTVATFAIDHRLWEGKPYGFHVTNAALNAVNAALLCVVVMLMFGPTLKLHEAALAAGVFAVHPVHTEAVNMIVGRTELLAAFFSLLTFILYLRKQLVASLAMFFLALLSKEIAVTVPVMILGYDVLSKQEIEKRNYWFFAAVLASYVVIRSAVLGGVSGVHQAGILAHQDAMGRVATVIYVVGLYVKLLFLPFYLTADYSDYALPDSLVEPKVLIALLVVGVAMVVAWQSRRKRGMLSLAALWFFIAILPVSNIISIGALVAERFIYLPSVALALLGASGLVYSRPFVARVGVLALCGCAVGVFGVLTVNRNKDWKDSYTVFAAAAKYQPDNPRVNYFLGERAEAHKDTEKAITYYERAIRDYPGHNWTPDSKTRQAMRDRIAILYYNDGLRLYRDDKLDAAFGKLTKALENNERYADAYVVLGAIYVRRNDPPSAARAFQKALEINPAHPEARENLRRVREFTTRSP